MSRRHIEAIEEGRVEDLPHPVYVKGFVKIYASMLGVEVKGISATVDKAFVSVMEDECQDERRRSPRQEGYPAQCGTSEERVDRHCSDLDCFALDCGHGPMRFGSSFSNLPRCFRLRLSLCLPPHPRRKLRPQLRVTGAQTGSHGVYSRLLRPRPPFLNSRFQPFPKNRLLYRTVRPWPTLALRTPRLRPQEGLLVAPPLAGPQAPSRERR